MQRHDVDLVGLTSGVVFVALAVGYFSTRAADVSFDALWFLPGLLIAFGLLLGGSALRRARTSQPVDNEN